MCGIAGIVAWDRRWEEHNPSHFLKDLEHRGPDDEGWLLWEAQGAVRTGKGQLPSLPYRVALLFRRLAILDLTERGHQPMGDPEGKLWIVFNGEIYNYIELREELSRKGYTFRSHTDTEVLLYAYHCYREQALERLVGMFAFAILDGERKELFLARDFFGIKPLFYTFTPYGVAFASEIPPLLKLPGVKRVANLKVLYPYLKNGLLDFSSETFFLGIQSLPPGTYLKLPLFPSRDLSFSLLHQGERLKEPPAPVRYFTLLPEEGEPGLTLEKAGERLREIFLENVRLHLRSDVPVGTALSGGIDSSAIVCAMRHLEPEQEIHAFSFVARGYPMSEEKWVDLVARHARLISHKIEITAGELVRDLDELIHTQGEPCGSTSIYAQFRVFRKVQEVGIKVILDGQGSDEMFAGYLPYLSARLLSLLRAGKLREARVLYKALPRQDRLSTLRFLWFLVRSFLPPSLVPALRNLFARSLHMGRGIREEWFRHQGIGEPVLPAPPLPPLKAALLKDFTLTSLPGLLRYEDRDSMHFSIESRVPFLTPNLARFTFSLPEEYIIAPDGLTKRVLRLALRGLVPEEILARRDKIGFATPESAWFKELYPWIEERLSGETLRMLPFFDPERTRAEWRAVMEGKAPFDFRIWRWVNLLRWFELFEVSLP